MRPSTSGEQSQSWQPLLAARLVVLVAFVDLFMQFPIVAPYARGFGASASLVGLVVAAYSATNLIGNVIAGVALDRWGRRLPILAGLLGTAAALLGYVFVRTPQQLIIARAVHGLTAAMLTPGAFAILGDLAAPDKRARIMGISGAIIAVAAVAGPSIAGIIGEKVGFKVVFLLSSTLMLATFAAFWRLSTKQIRGEVIDPHVLTGLSALIRRPRLVVTYLSALALTIGLGTLVAHLPITLLARGELPARSGLAFTVFAIVATIAMASPLNRVSDRYGRVSLVVAGLGLTCAGMLMLGSSRDIGSTMVGMGIFGLGFGVLFPSMTAFVAEDAAMNERGKAFGLFYAIYSLGVVIGSVLSGLLAEHLGETTGVPFLLGAAITLAAVPVITIVWNMQRGNIKRG